MAKLRSGSLEGGYDITSEEIIGSLNSLNTNAKDTIVDAINELVGDLSSGESSSGANLSSLTALVNSNKGNISTIEGEVSTLTSTQQTLQSDISTLTSTQQTLQSDISTLTSTQQSLESEVNTNKGSISTIEGEVSTLTSTQQTLQSDISSIQQSVSTVTEGLGGRNLLQDSYFGPTGLNVNGQQVLNPLKCVLKAGETYTFSAKGSTTGQLDINLYLNNAVTNTFSITSSTNNGLLVSSLTVQTTGMYQLNLSNSSGTSSINWIAIQEGTTATINPASEDRVSVYTADQFIDGINLGQRLRLCDNIVINDTITVHGGLVDVEGNNFFNITYTGSGSLMTFYKCQSVKIHNINFIGDASSVSGQTLLDFNSPNLTVIEDGSHNIVVENCSFTNAEVALFLGGCSGAKFEGNYVGEVNYGAVIRGKAMRVIFNGNTMFANTQVIYMGPSLNPTVDPAHYSGNYPESPKFTDNVFDMYVYNQFPAASTVANSSIICIEGVMDAVFTGNWISNLNNIQTGGCNYGIYISRFATAENNYPLVQMLNVVFNSNKIWSNHIYINKGNYVALSQYNVIFNSNNITFTEGYNPYIEVDNFNVVTITDNIINKSIFENSSESFDSVDYFVKATNGYSLQLSNNTFIANGGKGTLKDRAVLLSGVVNSVTNSNIFSALPNSQYQWTAYANQFFDIEQGTVVSGLWDNNFNNQGNTYTVNQDEVTWSRTGDMVTVYFYSKDKVFTNGQVFAFPSDTFRPASAIIANGDLSAPLSGGSGYINCTSAGWTVCAPTEATWNNAMATYPAQV